jgi:hypothetical protein
MEKSRTLIHQRKVQTVQHIVAVVAVAQRVKA